MSAEGWCPSCLETQQAESPRDYSCRVCGAALRATPTDAPSTGPEHVQQQVDIGQAIHSFLAMIDRGGMQADALGLPGLPPDVLQNLTALSHGTEARPSSEAVIAKLPRFTGEENSWILHTATLRIKGLPRVAEGQAVAESHKKVLVIDALIGELSSVQDQVFTATLAACDPLTAEANKLCNQQQLSGAIAVAVRGVSTFAAKALTLKAAGCRAAIIVQSADVWPYIMKDSKKEAADLGEFPVCMVNKPSGKLLLDGLKAATAPVHCELAISQSKKDCVICVEPFALGSQFVRLPCGHLFHGECVKAWLQRRNTCPTCRFELQTGNPEHDARIRREQSTVADWSQWYD
jgi:hypothetical protein